MAYINNITKEKKFKHLNYKQRKIIEKLLEEKKNRNTKLLGIFRSALYEEIKRGNVKQRSSDLMEYTKYFAESGQITYEKNKKIYIKRISWKRLLILLNTLRSRF